MKVLAISVIELSLSDSRRGGTAVYIASLIKALQEIAEVDLCLLNHDHNGLSWTRGNLIRLEIDPIPNLFVRQWLSWYVGVKPAVWRYTSKSLKSFLKKIALKNYAAVIFLDENAAIYEKFLPVEMPKILVRHNLDSESIKLKKDSFFGYLRALSAKHLSRRFDRWTLRRFSKVTIGSESEQKILQTLGNPSSVSLLPTITRFDIEQVLPNRRSVDEKSQKAIFIGDFKYPPNVEAVHWFIKCQEYFSPERLATLEVVLVGRSPPDIPSDCKINVVALGFVDDLSSVLSQCQLAIIPIVSGSGVKVKTLTLLASGLPVVTTSEGVEGINVTNGVDCLIADDQKSFSESVERLCSDSSFGDLLQTNGRKLIQENFSAQRQNESLRNIISDAIKVHRIEEHA